MSFINRFLGIFLNPQQTQKAISERPKWVDALVLILIVLIIISFVTAPYQQKDTYDITKDSIKLRERMGDERFEEYLETIKNPSQTGLLIRTLAIVPISLVIGFLFQCLILFGMSRFSSTEGKFMQIFAVFLHARFIDTILGGTIRTLLVLIKKSFFQTSTSLALFFPKLEVASTAFIVLSQFDIFTLWAHTVLGMGLAYVFKIDLKKGLIFSYILWLLKAIVYISMGLISRAFV